jgi:hypothetical protein
MKRRAKTRKVAVAAAALLPLTLTACAGASASGTESPDTLTIQDYLDPTRDPLYHSCAKNVGVSLQINHVAGPGLIPHPARRAHARQPRRAADRRVRRAVPAVRLRHPRRGPIAGRGEGGHVRGRAVRSRPRRQHPEHLLQQGPVPGGGHHDAAEDVGRAARHREEAHRPRPVRLRDEHHQHLRGHLAVPAVHVGQRRHGKGHHDAGDRTGAAVPARSPEAPSSGARTT